MAAQAALNSAVLSSTTTNNHRANAASLINGHSSTTTTTAPGKSASHSRYTTHGQSNIPASSYSGLVSNQNASNAMGSMYTSNLMNKTESGQEASSAAVRRSARINNSANNATHRRY